MTIDILELMRKRQGGNLTQNMYFMHIVDFSSRPFQNYYGYSK